MKRILKSIKGQLFCWFFTFSSAILLAVGLFMYYEIKEIVFHSVDHTLHSKMQMITGLLHEEHGMVELELSEVISGEYSIPRSGHYYKVIMDGKILAASPSLVDDNYNLTSGTLEYHDRKLKEKVFTSIGPDGKPIRVLQHDLEFLGRSFSVFVAESLTDSLTIIGTFRKFLLIIIPASIFIVSLVGLWITNKSLKPINILSGRIKTITHKNLNERIDAETEAEELTGLADSFNEMLNRLQQAFEAEKRLISDASHELKTPVSVIKTHCDVMLQKERSREELIETLRTIKTVSENMGKLIKDLLSLARLDSGILSPANFKNISLNECILQAIQLTKPLAERKHVSVKTLLVNDINIIGDKDRLTEAFLNMIENAVNYNKDNGAVEIATAIKNNKVNISIKDTGLGIKKEDLERIFERFYRTDASRSMEGTGLGLSIAKAIIEAHGGMIKAESEFGRGSCFTIILPLSSDTEQE
jgi:hypothetical protein